MGKEKILVVEDEKLIRWSLTKQLRKEGYIATEAETGEAALELLEEESFDLLLLDFKLPGISGLEVLEGIHKDQPDLPTIIITAHGTVDNAVHAMKLGAYDYINKPFNTEELLLTIRKALETTHLKKEVQFLRREQHGQYTLENVIGENPRMQEIFALVEKICKSDATTVLIQGESGTGKDLLAKTIHTQSRRQNNPFMTIAATALPETLLESELFGHEKGAFTDAKSQKKGLIEIAHGGTVYLDEIGDIGGGIQSKLLRVLEEKTFKRVGGTRDIGVDVRIIAATNKNLKQAVEQGDFREDLFYRLHVLPIYLPPLRQRQEDIEPLLSFFIERFNSELKREVPVEGVTKKVLETVHGYSWPGNVRELKNLVERAMILSNKPVLDLEDFHLEMSPLETRSSAGGATGNDHPLQLTEAGIDFEDLEEDLVRQALEITRGNQSQAAKLLHMTRDQIRYRIEKFNISRH